MEVENIAGEGFASWRPAQKERYLAVGHGVLPQIVINNEGVAARIAELFAHCGARVRSDILQGSRVAGACRYDDGIFHSIVFFKRLHHAKHGGLLLADGDIYTVNRISGVEFFFLVDDRINADGGLARLAVADDKFALAATDRDHGVDSFDTGLQRFLNRLPAHDIRGVDLNRPQLVG